MFVVLVGKLDEFPPFLSIKYSKHKVAQSTFPDILEFSTDEGLIQEETDQIGLVVRKTQDPEALQNTRDAQVVVSAADNDSSEMRNYEQDFDTFL